MSSFHVMTCVTNLEKLFAMQRLQKTKLISFPVRKLGHILSKSRPRVQKQFRRSFRDYANNIRF